MAAKGLKDYASEKGMKISNGVAYGVIGGYMVTLKEGYGIKNISFSGAVTDECAGKITAFLQSKEANKEYRVAQFNIMREGISIDIADTVGTMKRIRAFLDFFPNFLRENGIIGDGFCTACGNTIESTDESRIVLINGVAHRIHGGCSGAVMERADVEQARYETEEKNLGKGILGAVLGALLGTIVWAIVYYIGYVAAIVGALIGVLAVKGYEKMGGKPCKAKMPITLVLTLLGVLVGQFAGGIMQIMIDGGWPLLDAIYYHIYIFEDPEFTTAFVGDLIMGVVFALLGVFGILRKTSKENKEAALRTTVLE
ncbi:MAG: hypothetical protein E7557_08060 [Ruminococcaceae bacterium]|nr:hypothetical protein [Oscillospiraceae bacterium]